MWFIQHWSSLRLVVQILERESADFMGLWINVVLKNLKAFQRILFLLQNGWQPKQHCMPHVRMLFTCFFFSLLAIIGQLLKDFSEPHWRACEPSQQGYFWLPLHTGHTSHSGHLPGSCKSHFYRRRSFHWHLPGHKICCSYKNVLALVLLPSSSLNAVLSAPMELATDACLCGQETTKILLLGLMCQLCFWWSCRDSDHPPVQFVLGKRWDRNAVLLFLVCWAEKGGLCSSHCCLSCIDFYNELQESSCQSHLHLTEG